MPKRSPRRLKDASARPRKPGWEKPEPIETRFWKKVDRCGPDECWNWIGGKKSTGYGFLIIRKKHYGAHRIAWELANGPFPEPENRCHHGVVVRHTCDNRACVNPAHLKIGSQSENMWDMIEKGTFGLPMPKDFTRPEHKALKCKP